MPVDEIDISTCNPKQLQFMRSRAKYTAYGGARGGGKSWAVRKKAAMLALWYPGIKILVLRRTYPELEANHIRQLRKELHGIATYTQQRKEFAFGGGSLIKLGHYADDGDATQYQGQEYDVIFIDEATQFTEWQYQTLTACLRGANPFPKRMYLTCNPGGVGHEWVKRLFVTREYKTGENPDDYLFIQATVRDNHTLMTEDPDYIRKLEALDEPLRSAWLDGNWDLLAGMYFNEFDRSIHVVPHVPLQPHWRVYRAIDYGLDCLACVWVARDELGNSWVYREYAGADKAIAQGAGEILSLSHEPVQCTLAPTDLWGRTQESGRTKADLFAAAGLPIVKSRNDREAGWLTIKDLLRIRDGDAQLKIHQSCAGLIKCLTALQRDPKRPTDCMTEPHDITHLPDALRYYAIYWTSKARVPVEEDDDWGGKRKPSMLPGRASRGFLRL